jgi:hypothetical protein
VTRSRCGTSSVASASDSRAMCWVTSTSATARSRVACRIESREVQTKHHVARRGGAALPEHDRPCQQRDRQSATVRTAWNGAASQVKRLRRRARHLAVDRDVESLVLAADTAERPDQGMLRSRRPSRHRRRPRRDWRTRV